MGELGRGRNNKLSQNGLLNDKDGNVFDLTQWYKTNNLSIDLFETSQEIVDTLKRIETHLALITGNIITNEDIK